MRGIKIILINHPEVRQFDCPISNIISMAQTTLDSDWQANPVHDHHQHRYHNNLFLNNSLLHEVCQFTGRINLLEKIQSSLWWVAQFDIL